MEITTLSAVSLCKSQVIAIGRQMENEYRQIIFDCSGFGPDITSITLVHQRSQDTAPYIVGTFNSNPFVWTIDDTDTAYYGYGKGELRISFTSGLAKSIVFTTLTVKSITADTVIPEPLQSWYDAMIDYIDENAVTLDEVDQAIEDYLEQHPVQAPVQSVNSMTGDVVITAASLGALTSESDPVFGASAAAGITSTDITAWNGKYTKPASGIPATDLTSTVQSRLLKTGGTAGQVLAKVSGTNYDVAWTTVSGGGAVDSVNGQTGVVVLDADDVGALPDNTTAADLGAYVKPSGGIPKTDLASDVQTSLGKADTALQTAPVISVNGQTGAVVIPTGGLTQAQIDALDGMFQAAAYAEDATAEYAAFCTAFGITQTYSITNTLTHVTNSNAATSITGGSSYTGTLTADSGYNIDTVTVTMGGVDITSTAYSAGSISIASVTGNIVITATATSSGGKSDMNGWTDGVAYTDLTIVQNEYVNNTTGAFDTYNGWNRTGYVPINGASTLDVPKLPGSGGDTRYCGFYQQDHTWIERFDIAHGTGLQTISVPSNAYYFVLSETVASLAYWIETGIIPNA